MKLRFKERCAWFRLAGVALMLGPLSVFAQVRLVGSDILGDDFKTAVAAFAKGHEIDLQIDLSGSLTARRDLENGAAQIAVMSLVPGEASLAPEYYTASMAYHLAVLWAPAEVPLAQLSYRQLASVFGNHGSNGRIRWRDLGVSGPGATRGVIPTMLQGSSALSWPLLRHQVFPRGAEVNEPAVGNLTGATEGDVIALSSDWASVGGNLKPVPISITEGGAAFAPTAANVIRGDYPLSWPVLVAFRKSEIATLYPLLRYLLGDEVAAACQKAQLMPVSDEARRKLIFELEQL